MKSLLPWRNSASERLPVITIEIRDEGGCPVLYINGPSTPVTIPLGGSTERVRELSAQIQRQFAGLATDMKTDDHEPSASQTLEQRARRTQRIVDDVFHQLLEKYTATAQGYLSRGPITPAAALRSEIMRLRAKGRPVYFRSLEHNGPLPWELFVVDPATGQRLSQIAWIARIDRNRVSPGQLPMMVAEMNTYRVSKPMRIKFFKGHGLPAADDELQRVHSLQPHFYVDCLDDQPRRKTRKQIVASIADAVGNGYDFLHFACHCHIRKAEGSSFALDIAGTNELSDNDISRGLIERNLQGDLPITFLNICYGAIDRVQTLNPTEQFLGLGAKAVISAADLVNDDAAPIFAEAVYAVIAERLWGKNAPKRLYLSEALFEARNMVRAWAEREERQDRARAQTALERLTPETFMITAEGGDLLLSAA